MATTADVVIVGGGIIGAAIGFECARRGLPVLLIEREVAGGAGATRYSRGIVRAYDPDLLLMQWSLESIGYWRDWSRCGPAGPSPFRECGVLYVLAPQNVEHALRVAASRYPPEYPAEILRGRELRERFAHLPLACRPEDGLVALWEPRGGYLDTRLATRLFIDGMRAHGATVLEALEVERLLPTAGGVCVHVGGATLRAGRVVLAAGAHSPALVGDLPLRTRSIPMSCFRHSGDGPTHCVIDEPSGAYLRPEPPEHLYTGGGAQRETTLPNELPPLDAMAREASDAAARELLGGTHEMTSLGAFQGWDGYTADLRPLLGEHPRFPALYLATGFSGRGAKYAPTVGIRVAATIGAVRAPVSHFVC